ncbi:deSI-like protein At4g17486 isoform X2 [Magnolia sinica]|uniref:deSI-like protein At4g17486 isoform X2 n=1 Tax=Magnolia sinica TaxID=86752 RepID=UPI00265807E0|nr:deSI-like protein At4g17486 isoform X2 [Magnolia sinica]
MFIKGFSSKRKIGSVPVYLNVYDLTTINGYAYWLGLGIYHSGVQVHDVEYAFGAHEFPTTGIFEGEPRQCPGFTFRKSILIGRTDLGPKEVREFMEKLAEEYTGNMYHLITKNCNHFCDDACLRLTGKPIPRWVNRLAKLGLLFICVLPVGIHPAAISHRSEDRVCDGERKKLWSNSSRYISPPAPASTSEGGSVHPIASVTRSRCRWSEPCAPSLVTASLTLKL